MPVGFQRCLHGGHSPPIVAPTRRRRWRTPTNSRGHEGSYAWSRAWNERRLGASDLRWTPDSKLVRFYTAGDFSHPRLETAAMGVANAEQTFREVMTQDPPEATTPCEVAYRDFVFGRVWPRPGLSRRDRRWVTLTCVAAADSPQPIEDHVYAALNSGDIELAEMLEFILQFAVYCGWPKAAHCEGAIHRQWARINKERGQEVEEWPMLVERDPRFQRLGEADRAGGAGVRRREPDAGACTEVAVPPRRHPQLRVRARLAAAGTESSRAPHHHVRQLSPSTTRPHP